MARNRASDQRERVLSRVAVFLNRDDLKRAAVALEEFLAGHPDDDRALLKLAEVRKRQGRFAEAVEVYLKTAALHTRGRFVLRAIAVLKQAYGIDPTNPGVLEQLAEGTLQLGQQHAALRYLGELAEACERTGDHERRRSTLNGALSLAPDSVELILRLVAAMRSLGKDAEATELLAQAAQRFATAKEFDKWLALAEPLAQHRPPDRAGRLELARAHLGRAHPKQALRHLQACLALDRTDAEVLELVVQVFAALGLETKAQAARRELEASRFEVAFEEEEELVELVSSPADDEEELIELEEVEPFAVEVMLGRFRAGVAEVVRPDDAATHQDLGIAFFEMALFTQAAEEFQAALKADPTRKPECLTMMARCRLGQGDADEAIELLERVIVLPELAPDTRATAYLHLAEAHEAAGKRPAALLHAKEARRLAPSLPGLAKELARLEGLERMLIPGPEFLSLEQTPTPA